MKGLWLLLLIGSMFFPNHIHSENIAVVIRPYDTGEKQWTNDLTNIMVNILEEQGYRIVWIESGADIRLIVADRIILVFVGHSNQNNRDELWATWGLIRLSDMVSHLHTRELIMLSNTCGGGYWISQAKENTIVIATVNHTKSIMETYYTNGVLDTPTPHIGTLLRLSKLYTLETAYTIWEEQLLEYYNQDSWGGHYSDFTPVMYDGISGDVWI